MGTTPAVWNKPIAKDNSGTSQILLIVGAFRTVFLLQPTKYKYIHKHNYIHTCIYIHM